jgi:hypothetical protein
MKQTIHIASFATIVVPAIIYNASLAMPIWFCALSGFVLGVFSRMGSNALVAFLRL